jgi:hypothetical protein
VEHDYSAAESIAGDPDPVVADAYDDALWSSDPDTPDMAEDDVESGPRFRVAKAILTLLVVAALLTYFIVPFGNTYFTGNYLRLRLPTGVRPIPLSPPHQEGTRSQG